MPLVKDISYLQIPYSSETPDEDFHFFMSIKDVKEKISKHQKHPYRCRTVGVIFCVGQAFYLHELDDTSAEVRVSLIYLSGQLPFSGLPFTAQLFGFAHWMDGIGPVLYPLRVATVSPFLARRIRSIMQWVIESHFATNPGTAGMEKKVLGESGAESADFHKIQN